MPEPDALSATVEPENPAVEVQVIQDKTVTLYKHGLSITVSEEQGKILQNEGWMTFVADLPAMAREIAIVCEVLLSGVYKLVEDVEADGNIDPSDTAQLFVVSSGINFLETKVRNLLYATQMLYPIKQPTTDHPSGEEVSDV